jgi:hypothetical protein
MRDHSIPNGLCTLDPLSAMVGGIIPSLLGGGSSPSPAPTPAAPPPQAPPAKTPAPKQSTQQSSFIGGVPTPPPSTGQKTLLGQ